MDPCFLLLAYMKFLGLCLCLKLVVIEPGGHICGYRVLPSLWGAILPLSGHRNPDLSTPTGPAEALFTVPTSCQLPPALLPQLLPHQSSRGPQTTPGGLEQPIQSPRLPEARNKDCLHLPAPFRPDVGRSPRDSQRGCLRPG